MSRDRPYTRQDPRHIDNPRPDLPDQRHIHDPADQLNRLNELYARLDMPLLTNNNTNLTDALANLRNAFGVPTKTDPINTNTVAVQETDSVKLKKAIETHNVEKVKQLLATGVDINNPDDFFLSLAIHCARKQKFEPSIFDDKKQKEFEELRNKFMHSAATEDNFMSTYHSMYNNEIVDLLLDAKADINLTTILDTEKVYGINKSNNKYHDELSFDTEDYPIISPLTTALKTDNIQILNKLLALKCNTNISNLMDEMAGMSMMEEGDQAYFVINNTIQTVILSTLIEAKCEIKPYLRSQNNIMSILLQKENDELKQKIKQLEDELTELRFRPGADGYLEAKAEFESLSQK